MYISIEIVPRTRDHVTNTLERICEKLPKVNMVNIPDIMRFKTRSWEGCGLAQDYYKRRIPHIRAVDFSLDEPFPLIQTLEESDIDELLVVSGDTDKTSLRKTYNTGSIALIKKLKRELPHLTLYAALDPYRQSFLDEVNYVHEKLEAGAEGVFTQPFFDVRLMEVYAEILPAEMPVYWGVTPVTSENSVNYWKNVNNAIFPADFDVSMTWNRKFAKQALDFVEAHQGHIYFMPIRADVIEYLEGIL
jgi:methylenetetrahydrofolate reductase (NADPH)